MKNTFKIASIALAVATLAGCGENAKIDFNHSNKTYAEDSSMLVGYALPLDEIEGTILDKDTAKKYGTLFSDIDSLVQAMPYTEEASTAWIADVNSKKAALKELEMGQYADDLGEILDDMTASMASRILIVNKAETKEQVLEYLKRDQRIHYNNYAKAIAKLEKLNGFGKAEYEALQEAETKYEKAKEASDLEKQYREKIAQYVTEQSIPVSKKNIRSDWDVQREWNDEGTTKCTEDYSFYSEADGDCYHIEFSPFYYSQYYKKLTEQQKADLKKIGLSLIEPQKKVWLEYRVANSELDKARSVNDDKSAIASNKFGTTYGYAKNQVFHAAQTLSYRSSGLYDVNKDVVNTKSKGYSRYINKVLTSLAINNGDIMDVAESRIKKLGTEGLNTAISNTLFEKATEFDIESDGTFSVEPNMFVMITAKPEVAKEHGEFTILTSTGEEADEIIVDRSNAQLTYQSAATTVVEEADIIRWNNTFKS